MQRSGSSPTAPLPGTPRRIADDYVDQLAELNPVIGTLFGVTPDADGFPDYSPAGHAALAALERATLARLDAVGEPGDVDERRAARLLRERLGASLALEEAGENLREVNNIFCPVQQQRAVFQLMPTATDEDWAVIGRRLRNVPAALRGYADSLRAGSARGLNAAPRQVETVVEQLDAWLESDWYRTFAAGGPEAQRTELAASADAATAGLADLRAYLSEDYLPAVAGTPDAVGRERYRLSARLWTGSDLDLADAYAYGWEEFHRLEREMRAVAAEILPGESTFAAMQHLEKKGQAIDGEEEIRVWLQELTERAIRELDGTHFELADPIKRVEARIAPSGSAAGPYYSRPSLDFARPGQTWLPTLGATRFPVWNLVSTWYHEGVPGHHLQLAQWVLVQDRLSRFQVSVGSVGAATEGWALYAERLMDELGYLTDPAHRLGYLSAQMLRAVRVIIDIGMHLELKIPAGESYHPGEVWTPQLAAAFLMTHTGTEPEYTRSELTRYLGQPGQAISYKLGERAWLAGREAARTAGGAGFDLKAWHMAALSLGSLGLDDLTDELAAL
ncbi:MULTISPECIES: DUF885 domain-containing protein [Streptomyces]|uniref:Uncharacterized conserved protein, DUF885 familyt n=1 Tax=Streptomyces harbinensis TaxID=1176198 RepID=A0A1I6QMG5_9ACTN|nr:MULTISPECIES: DUF885 domain-containing protein [Streptomyces]SFS53667.1 Uncharacterized conserved protein, DUF885 familyt [Streptomyces harbinensis]